LLIAAWLFGRASSFLTHGEVVADAWVEVSAPQPDRRIAALDLQTLSGCRRAAAVI